MLSTRSLATRHKPMGRIATIRSSAFFFFSCLLPQTAIEGEADQSRNRSASTPSFGASTFHNCCTYEAPFAKTFPPSHWRMSASASQASFLNSYAPAGLTPFSFLCLRHIGIEFEVAPQSKPQSLSLATLRRGLLFFSFAISITVIIASSRNGFRCAVVFGYFWLDVHSSLIPYMKHFVRKVKTRLASPGNYYDICKLYRINRTCRRLHKVRHL